MSEEKRVTLISFGPQKDNVKKKSGNSKTVRICLVLPESNEDTYPEFNYKEELAALKVSYNRKWLRFQGKGTPDYVLNCKYSNFTVVVGRNLHPNMPKSLTIQMCQHKHFFTLAFLIFYYSKCPSVCVII